MTSQTCDRLRFASRAATASGYARNSPAGIDLWLDANEGPLSSHVASTSFDPALVRRYPEARALEAQIGSRFGVSAERVVVTAGGDDAISRVCQSFCEPGRPMVMHDPSFVMIERYATLAGAEVIRVPWLQGPFPEADMIAAIERGAGLIALVSPNNPTGRVIDSAVLTRLIDTAGQRGVPVLFDAAYAEFGSADPTRPLLEHPHVVVVRTFSKAYGLAGLRVGYAIASVDVAARLRAVGLPYPASSIALQRASEALTSGERAMRAGVEAITRERTALTRLLRDLGVEVEPSEANFVLARVSDSAGLQRRLAERGIAIRGFAGHSLLDSWVRITLPGCPAAFMRLCNELTTIVPLLASEVNP